MMVLEELDAAKKGLSEVARNVRQVSRFIGEMMQHQPHADLDEGLELREPEGLELKVGSGRLLFQTAMPETHSSLLRDGSFADNEILSTALALRDAAAAEGEVRRIMGAAGIPITKVEPIAPSLEDVLAAAEQQPAALVDQLAPGGRLLIPVGGRWSQTLLAVDKSVEAKKKGAGLTTTTDLGGCVFVPLIGEDGW